MKKVKITNMVKFYTLTLLYEKPRHGYEIIKNLSNSLEKEVSAGEIYPFLDLLNKNNYVSFKTEKSRGKKTYHLTKEGRNLVKELFSRSGNLAVALIESKIEVCAHCNCEIYKGGYEERIKSRILKFCCKYCAKSYKNRL
jgi:DNA-binding PadR family transcriptional regulator